jgi:predicted transcriptional regulator
MTAKGTKVGNHRDKYEIIKKILESLPTVKTNIMYHAEINYEQLCDYTKLLQKYAIIEIHLEKQDNLKGNGTITRNIYQITEKGKRFLNVINLLKEYEK